jgi:hypothetical protein
MSVLKPGSATCLRDMKEEEKKTMREDEKMTDRKRQGRR